MALQSALSTDFSLCIGFCLDFLVLENDCVQVLLLDVLLFDYFKLALHLWPPKNVISVEEPDLTVVILVEIAIHLQDLD